MFSTLGQRGITSSYHLTLRRANLNLIRGGALLPLASYNSVGLETSQSEIKRAIMSSTAMIRPGSTQLSFALPMRFFSSRPDYAKSQLSNSQSEKDEIPTRTRQYSNGDSLGENQLSKQTRQSDSKDHSEYLKEISQVLSRMEQQRSGNDSRDFGRFVANINRAIRFHKRGLGEYKANLESLATEIDSRLVPGAFGYSPASLFTFSEFVLACRRNAMAHIVADKVSRKLARRIEAELRAEPSVHEAVLAFNFNELVRMMQVYREPATPPLALFNRVNVLMHDVNVEKPVHALCTLVGRLAGADDLMVKQAALANQAARLLLQERAFAELGYFKKISLFQQLCFVQGSALAMRANNRTSELLAALATDICENIHQIDEPGVFSLLSALNRYQHLLSTDRTSKAMIALARELHSFVHHLIQEKPEAIAFPFLVDYQRMVLLQNKFQLRPPLALRTAINQLLKKMCQQEAAAKAFGTEKQFRNLLKAALLGHRYVPSLADVVRKVMETKSDLILRAEDITNLQTLASIASNSTNLSEQLTIEYLASTDFQTSRLNAGALVALGRYSESDKRNDMLQRCLDRTDTNSLRADDILDLVHLSQQLQYANGPQFTQNQSKNEWEQQFLEKLCTERILNPEDNQFVRLSIEKQLMFFMNCLEHSSADKSNLIEERVIPEFRRRLEIFPPSNRLMSQVVLMNALAMRQSMVDGNIDSFKARGLLRFFNEEVDLSKLPHALQHLLYKYVMFALAHTQERMKGFSYFRDEAMRTLNRLSIFSYESEVKAKSRQGALDAATQYLLDAKRIDFKLGVTPEPLLQYCLSLIADLSMLKGTTFERSLYSKFLAHVGAEHVPEDTLQLIQEFLESDEFDKEIVFARLAEEADPMELTQKLELLKLFRRATRRQNPTDSLDEQRAYQIALSLCEENMADLTNDDPKVRRETASKHLVLLFKLQVSDFVDQKSKARHRSLFKRCFDQVPFQNASRVVLYNLRGSGIQNGTVEFSSKLVHEVGMQEFFAKFGDKISEGDDLTEPKHLIQLFRIQTKVKDDESLCAADKCLLSGVKQKLTKFEWCDSIEMTGAMAQRGLVDSDLFERVIQSFKSSQTNSAIPHHLFQEYHSTLIQNMLQLDMQRSKVFLDLLDQIEVRYHTTLEKLVQENMSPSKQIHMLQSIFANRAENHLTFWTYLAESLGQISPDQLEALGMEDLTALWQLKSILDGKNEALKSEAISNCFEEFEEQVKEQGNSDFGSASRLEDFRKFAQEHLQVNLEIFKQIGGAKVHFFAPEQKVAILLTQERHKLVDSSQYIQKYRFQQRLMQEADSGIKLEIINEQTLTKNQADKIDILRHALGIKQTTKTQQDIERTIDG